jgi:hypothetical protein
MSDPIAQNASFLKTSVSPATLVGYAKWFGKVDDVASAEMTAIYAKVICSIIKMSSILTSTAAEHDT